jgi:hypothetical protein
MNILTCITWIATGTVVVGIGIARLNYLRHTAICPKCGKRARKTSSPLPFEGLTVIERLGCNHCTCLAERVGTTNRTGHLAFSSWKIIYPK